MADQFDPGFARLFRGKSVAGTIFNALITNIKVFRMLTTHFTASWSPIGSLAPGAQRMLLECDVIHR